MIHLNDFGDRFHLCCEIAPHLLSGLAQNYVQIFMVSETMTNEPLTFPAVPS